MQIEPQRARHEDLQIGASDGYALGARIYEPRGAAKAQVVIAGATGVPQGFYRRFAEYLVEGGYAVLTFDYRGIGASKPAKLRGFRASLLDWAQLDAEAAVRFVLPRGPTAVVGHSFGGHAYGLLGSVADTRGLYTFGTGAGWGGHMTPAERIKVGLLWNVVAPAFASAHGYLAWSRLGMGEDLPLDVYRQWRAWCRNPNFWFDDPRYDFAAQFARVTQSVVSVTSVDDPWAPPRSAAAFMRGYAQADLTLLTVPPAAPTLGHMGYFREMGRPLWPAVRTWLEARAVGAS